MGMCPSSRTLRKPQIHPLLQSFLEVILTQDIGWEVKTKKTPSAGATWPVGAWWQGYGEPHCTKAGRGYLALGTKESVVLGQWSVV